MYYLLENKLNFLTLVSLLPSLHVLEKIKDDRLQLRFSQVWESKLNFNGGGNRSVK